MKVIAQAAAVFDIVGDPDRVQDEAIEVLHDFDKGYVTPTQRERENVLDALSDGVTDEDAPDDLLTMALQCLRENDDTFANHGLVVREVALFLHGGSHTSAQTLCNVFYYLLGLDCWQPRTEWLERVAEDPLEAQKCVHETVRLRPPNPGLKRCAEHDAQVAGIPVRQGSTVVLDARRCNREPALFGAESDRFHPDREIHDDVGLWGLSFGAGPHICIGRSVAGGFPLTGARLREGVPPNHLYGLVALMVQAIAARRARGPRLAAGPDRRTTRGTRWLRFPVRFPDTAPDRVGERASAGGSRASR